GLVIVPYGHASDCQSIEVIEAAHPEPDAAGVAAATRILEMVSGLSADDTVVCLISGGGSSLLCLPIAGVTLAEKRNITSQLLRSGAAINEINCVRKKLSAIKGGKLAAACAPARVVTLIISDVPGNDISMVASGPTVSDASPASEALDILDRYAINVSDTARQSIRNSRPVTIAASDVRILASSDDALIASAALAEERDITPYVLGDLSGDARRLANEHAELALQIAAGHGPLSPPCVILSGGETTVNVCGDGRGGRNGEYALALAIALDGHPAIHAIACDTDGIDGTGDNAGCFVTPDVLERAANAGVDAKMMLERNDSYGFFDATLDLIVTGPTRTNVNDFRALLISAT
ncbi:MAG: glycerate kinase, partial [Gammaproteobacteria bacterium]|nr:glycerate kinase [Gammaproteobacteria bacterium]